jgi:hypothetical protein
MAETVLPLRHGCEVTEQTLGIAVEDTLANSYSPFEIGR